MEHTIHVIIPTELGTVPAGSRHPTFKIIIIIVSTIVTLIIIIIIIWAYYSNKRHPRSILPYHHNTVIPFISTTAPATSKESTCSEQYFQKQVSSLISLPPKIQRIDSFRPISLPLSLVTSIPFGQEIIRDPMFCTFIKEMSTYAFHNLNATATPEIFSADDAIIKKPGNTAVVSCVTNNNFAGIIRKNEQTIYLLERESLSPKRASLTSTVGSNKSVQSLQWVEFTENMDKNYLKGHILEITNPFPLLSRSYIQAN